MTLAVVANLTVNEMENSHRYTHFHSDDGTKYHNRFDRGWHNNCLEFWRGHQERIDWDAMKIAVDKGEAPGPPRGSYSWFQNSRAPKWLKRMCRIAKPPGVKGQSGGHGHTHGGAPCEHGHGAQEDAGATKNAIFGGDSSLTKGRRPEGIARPTATRTAGFRATTTTVTGTAPGTTSRCPCPSRRERRRRLL
jgi:palmitoyltransferase